MPHSSFAQRLVRRIDVAREKLGISEKDFHVLDTPEGQEYILRMLIGLEKNSMVMTAGAARFVPAGFFKDRPGLSVSEAFMTLIVKHAKVVDVGVSDTPRSLDLKEGASDVTVREEKLPADHVFDGKTEFCPMLASLIDAQWHGNVGALLNNGVPNIFHVRVGVEIFTVPIYWLSAGRWHADAWLPDDDMYPAGYRFFSRNSCF